MCLVCKITKQNFMIFVSVKNVGLSYFNNNSFISDNSLKTEFLNNSEIEFDFKIFRKIISLILNSKKRNIIMNFTMMCLYLIRKYL